MIALKKTIHSMITTPPMPGFKLKHSKQLKSHLLFDGKILAFLKVRKTLGAFDEQNIEGVHPEFNQLFRQYSNTCGAFQKSKMFRGFLMKRSSWMVKDMDDMFKATSRKKKEPDMADKACDAGSDENLEGYLELADADEEQMDEEEDEEVALCIINANNALHAWRPGVETSPGVREVWNQAPWPRHADSPPRDSLRCRGGASS